MNPVEEGPVDQAEASEVAIGGGLELHQDLDLLRQVHVQVAQ